MLERQLNITDYTPAPPAYGESGETLPNGVSHVARVVNAPSIARSEEFRERLMARQATRPLSTLAMLADLEMSDEARKHHKRASNSRKRLEMQQGDTPNLPDNAVSDKNGGFGGGGSGHGGGHGGRDGGSTGGGTDMSQIAWAGLAALGLAGLTVFVTQNTFGDDDTNFVAGTNTDGPSSTTTALASTDTSPSISSTAAAPAVRKPWFDYEGFVQQASALKAEREAEANELAKLEAERQLAEQTQREAERAQLAAAEAEALKLAAAEEAKRAEEDAEAKRLADLEAARLAKEETEHARLAALKAEEARKLAEAEAEARRKAEQIRKLAELEERNRLKAEAAEQARRLAEKKRTAELAALEAAKPAPTPVAFSAPAPSPASLKPAGRTAPQSIASTSTPSSIGDLIPINAAMPSTPALKPSQVRRLAASYASQTRTVQPAPAALRPSTVGSLSAPRRSAERASPQRVEAFMAERINKSAERKISDAEMDVFERSFLGFIESAPDGKTINTITPDGRNLVLAFEYTRPRQVFQPVNYETVSSTAPFRRVSSSRLQRTTIMCRDVEYAFPGFERGRFAACPTDDGAWRIARATDNGIQFQGASSLP